MKRIITTTALMACGAASAFMALGPATAHAATHGTAGIRIPLVTGTAPTVTNCDGRQEQFQLGAGNHLYHRYQITPGGSWSGWYSLGGYLISARIGAVRNSNCHLEAFGVGYGYAMWHIWQTHPGSGPWSGWASLGGVFTSGPTGVWVSTNHEAVIQANWASGAVVCDNQTAPSSGPWTGWYLCTPE
jgi:hypothetical protein